MRYMVIGVSKLRTGNYQGRDWQNYFVFGANEGASNISCGLWVDTIKVPSKFGSVVETLKPKDTVEIFYNRYGSVEGIQKV